MKAATIGFVYGLLFFPLFLVIGGGGHGLFFPLYAVGAPFTVLPVGILWIPILSGILAWCSTRMRAGVFLTAIVVHYCSAVAIGLWTFRSEKSDVFDPFDQKLHFFASWLAALCCLYLFGQMMLWVTFVRRRRTYAQLSNGSNP